MRQSTWADAFRRRLSDPDSRTAFLIGAATLLGPLGGFAANIVYARTLGPDGRGDLAAVIAALAVCEAVLVFGLPDVLTRLHARRAVSGQVLRVVLAVGLLGSIIPALVIALWAWDRGFGPAAVLSAAAVVPVATLASIGRGILSGRRLFKRLIACLVVGGAARILAPIVLLLADQDDPDLALLLVAASTIAASIPVFLARPFRGVVVAGAPRFREVAREALSIWPANMAWSLNARLDQLVLAVLVAPAQLGLYAVCVTLAELPVVMAAGLRQIVLVRVSEHGAVGAVLKLSYGVIGMGLTGAALAWAIGNSVLGWIFGPDFSSLREVLSALMVTSAFVISSGLLNSTLIARGMGKLTVISQTVGLVMSAGLLFVVIPLGGGIVGAALVSVATYAGVYLVALLLVKRTTALVPLGGSPA